ncbi:fibronectin type III domain-containing protein [Paenibacillus sp.]|uniref:fibronectin type III domain-containing protein n=1 Tax=Paenibacillus sp. TaxID=58172 RepID=UPI002810C552|nr:fibronectin type III domain-containing protein [Paenibacillus sp.]
MRVRKTLTTLTVAAMMASLGYFAPPSGTASAASVEVNVARGVVDVTTNGLATQNGKRLTILTDGVRTTSEYALISTSSGAKYVQLNLGEPHSITKLNLLNDYNPDSPRIGKDIIVQLSNDPAFASGVTTVYNNDADNSAGQGAGSDAEYTEPSSGAGLTVTLGSPVTAQYVRYWANGHTRTQTSAYNAVNTPVEVEVYAQLPGLNHALPAISSLSVSDISNHSVKLSWVSPGPSGITGYDIRYAEAPITESNWNNGSIVKRVVGEPSVAAAHATQQMNLQGLPINKKLYFAIKTVNGLVDASALSNAVEATLVTSVNAALNKTVTSNGTATGGTLSNVTNGNLTRDDYALISTSGGPKYVQIDLADSYDIVGLNLRNDWGTDTNSYRYGHDYVVQLAADAAFTSGVTTIFNNDADNTLGLGAGADPTYVEPVDGGGWHIPLTTPVTARYVRFWGNGHTRMNGTTHTVNTPVEIQAFAKSKDVAAPSAVTNLTAPSVGWKSVQLQWTAPGNDGATGTALEYDFRYSTSQITSANFGAATPMAGAPAPAVAGTTQTFGFGGLQPNTTYYFAMKAKDEANVSAMSNVVAITTPATDNVPPAAIANLATSRANSKSIQLSWTAPGDDGNAGRAASYEVRYSTSPITAADWGTATEAIEELLQLDPGTTMTYDANELNANTTYYFAVKTKDAAGNVSAISNVASATTTPPSPDAVTVSTLAALQSAIHAAPQSGRVITLAAGVYNVSSQISINGKDNITIQGATSNPEATVLKGPGMSSSLGQIFDVNDSHYLTIKNLRMQDTKYHGVKINYGSNYFTADNIVAWDHGEGGFKVTAQPWTEGAAYSDYGAIKNSRLGYTTAGNNNAVEAIDIIAGWHWKIQNNFFENTYKSVGNGVAYAVFAKGGARGTVIENNEFRNNFTAISFGGGGTGSLYFRHGNGAYEHYDGIVRNNVIIKTTDAAIYMNSAKDYKVYNNTIFNVGSGVGAIESRYVQSNGLVYNNLMNGSIKNRDGGTHTAATNLTNATIDFMVDAANRNYRLNPLKATAAINAGTSLPTEVPTDFYGDARPYGSAFDIGAVEFRPDETIPPATITLGAVDVSMRKATLTWTAPGDDGNTGTAFSYDLRYSTAPITAANWGSAIQLKNEPVPAVAGTTQTYTYYGIPAGGTYHFAIKAKDDMSQESALSNSLAVTTTTSSTTEFNATDDTYIYGGSVWGNAAQLLVKQHLTNNENLYAFLKFNLANFTPSSTWNAKLYINLRSAQQPTIPVTVFGVLDDNWSEATAKSTVQPDISNEINLGTFLTNETGVIEVDVTDFVNSQLAGDKVVTLRLADVSNHRWVATFESSESAVNQPFLLVRDGADTMAPATISDLAASNPTNKSIDLAWKATGDDGMVRNATSYDIRYSTSPITNANWNSATQVSGEPLPAAPGTTQSFTLYGLSVNTTYHFAMKATDDAGNVSALSNVASQTTTAGVNVALNKSVSASTTDLFGGALSVITDGVSTNSSAYAGIRTTSGPQYYQVDLGASYSLNTFRLVNDWGASGIARTNKDVIVQLSNSATFASGATTVYNNDANNSVGLGTGTDPEYQESAAGLTIPLGTPVNARYARVWGSGHVRTDNTTHTVLTPIEFEAYADPGDNTPPAAVTNLANAAMTYNSIDLTWTAPGDNGTSGQAKQYLLRYAPFAITESTWNSATPAAGVPLPKPAGGQEQFTVGGLTTNQTYHFALKTVDTANNVSALSNVVMATINNTDATAPGTIADLAVQRTGPRSVRLGWTAPGDDGATGHAKSYEVRYSTSPITAANWNSATEAIDELLQLPAGTAMKYQANELTPNTTYYFAVRTTDDVNNVSDISNVAVATTAYPVPDSVTVTSLADLQDAIHSAPPSGRVITLAAGTYSQTSSININGKDHITIRGATSNVADTVIVGPGITSNVDISIRVNDSSYVTIRDLTIRDFNYHAVQVNSGSYYFHGDNLYAWDLGEGAFKVTGAVSTSGAMYADYGLIENSTLGYTNGGKRSVVEAVDIIAARGWVVRGNTVLNAYHPSSGSVAYAMFAKGGSIDTIFENNLIKGSDIAISFGGGLTGSQYFRNGVLDVEHYGGIIRNNVIHNTDDAGIYLAKAIDFKVLNNTLINIAPNVSVGGIESRWAGSNGEIRNNLADKALKKRDGGNYTESNNIVNATSAWYVNPGAGNYALNASTAAGAINTGASLPTLVPTDMLGVARPIGTGYDLGALESGTPPADTTAPSAPAGLTSAGQTDTTVSLYWTSAADNVGVVGYDIYAGATKLNALPVTSTSYVAYNLNPLTAYSFTVKAKDRAGNVSASSNAVSVTTNAPSNDTVPPTVPADVASAGVTDTTVSLSWTPSTDNVQVAGYNVYEGTTKLNPSPIPTTSYTVTGLTPLTSYSFTVTAVDAFGNESAASAAVSVTTLAPPDTTPPSAPTLSGAGATETTASLSWTASVDNVAVAGYDVYNGTTKANDSLIPDTTYTVTGLTAATSYTFTVRAVDAANNESSDSNAVTVTTATYTPGDTTPPSAPTNFKFTARTDTTISVSWNASTDNAAVAGYDVYVGGAKVNPALVTGTTYVATGLIADTQYSIYVKAVDASNNESAASATINVRTLETPPAGALSRTGWTASGSIGSNALDGNASTRWYATSHSPSSSFQVDMKAEYDIEGLYFHKGTYPDNFSVDYTIETSTDGATWSTAGTADGTGAGSVTASFSSVTARYVRIVPTGSQSGWWSIAEFYVIGQ